VTAATPLLSSPSDSDPPAPVTPKVPLAQLVEDVYAADRCLARGDAAGARAALSSDHYWIYGELQIFARMAEAELGLVPVRLRDRFQKILRLACFVEAHEEKDPEERREMPIPGATWDRARLDELADRARAWLEGAGRGEG
jgi:hypothetical protein